MNNNEIKKALYKQKPIAKEVDVVGSGNLTDAKPYSVYQTQLADYTIIKFVVPHSEMGENRFEKELPSQLLIRWM